MNSAFCGNTILQMEEIRLHMLKFAQLQLKNYDLAEDMVQEAFFKCL